MTAKRVYKRLTPETWAEIETFWESGGHTLDDLSARFGVTTRALQFHFRKFGIVKGSKSAEIQSAAREAVTSDKVGDLAERTAKSQSSRASAFLNADRIEKMLMAQLSAAESDPENGFRAIASIKCLSMAAQILERIQSVKHTALGVEADQTDELPVIQFFDLTDEDIAQIKSSYGDREEEGEWAEEDIADSC